MTYSADNTDNTDNDFNLPKFDLEVFEIDLEFTVS
jgi:hypothetical protein